VAVEVHIVSPVVVVALAYLEDRVVVVITITDMATQPQEQELLVKVIREVLVKMEAVMESAEAEVEVLAQPESRQPVAAVEAPELLA
jgi:hypothetical protein